MKTLILLFLLIMIFAFTSCNKDSNPVINQPQNNWVTLFNSDYYDSLYCDYPGYSCGGQNVITQAVNFTDADSILFEADVKCSGSVTYKIYANSGNAFLITIYRDSTNWEHLSWAVPVLQKSEKPIYRETEIGYGKYYVLKNLKIYKK